MPLQNTSSSGQSPLATQHPVEYEAARELILAGVPLFVAPPLTVLDATTPERTEFKLPLGWQTATPNLDVLNRWQPGWALCAVTGHALDLIDMDPRNGSAKGDQAMIALDLWPLELAKASTPQGGLHIFVTALGCASINWMSRDGKTSGVAPGIDYKGGKPDGTGRGFAYIAPTVRKGGTYTWVLPPDHETIAIENEPWVPLREHIDRDRVTANVAPGASFADDPFDTPARTFTQAQARTYCMPALEAFAAMRTPEDHGFNAALNEVAVRFGHFVPEFMSSDRAVSVIWKAAVRNRSVEYQGEAGVRATLRSGLERGMKEPYRLVASDPAAPEEDVNPAGLITEFITAAQLREMPNPEPLITGVLDIDTSAWLIGKAGSYKSFIALDMIGHVALGKPWHGHSVRQGRCAYIVAEGVRGTKLRVAAFERTYGALGDTVLFLPRPVQVRNAGGWAALVEALVSIEPVFVVIDTQSRVSIGLKENDNTEMMMYVDAVETIRKATAACVLTLHHQGRAGLDARGASSIDGAQDTELRIERDADRHVIVHLDKQKDQDDTEIIDLDLIRSEGGMDMATGRDLSSLIVVTGGLAGRSVIKDWLDNLAPNQSVLVGVFADFMPNVGGTKADVRRLTKERIDMKPGSFARAWDALVTTGIIEQVAGSQRWVLTSMTPAN